MKSKFVLYPHAGSGNHGCEAIVRTTVQMVNGKEVTLFSDRPEEDKKYIDNVNINILKPQKSVSRASLGYISAFAKNHLFGKADAFDALNFAPVISSCDKNSVLMSIGGDNYCYGENEFIYMVNRYARAKGAKTVLWGCSVEPKDISDKMSTDLSGYDLITARETITYEALKKINPNTVLVSDPAFTLPVGDGKMPDGLGKNPFIGINVSPLIQKSESKDGITMENYRSLVEYILENTENDIALIPHVVWDGNDDREPLRKLYDEFKASGRILMVEDQNCTLTEICYIKMLLLYRRAHTRYYRGIFNLCSDSCCRLFG